MARAKSYLVGFGRYQDFITTDTFHFIIAAHSSHYGGTIRVGYTGFGNPEGARRGREHVERLHRIFTTSSSHIPYIASMASPAPCHSKLWPRLSGKLKLGRRTIAASPNINMTKVLQKFHFNPSSQYDAIDIIASHPIPPF